MRTARLIWLHLVRRCRSERYFQIRPPFRGPGWYFDVRGAEPWGPYSTVDDARLVAKQYAAACRSKHDTGGRNDLVPSDALVFG